MTAVSVSEEVSAEVSAEVLAEVSGPGRPRPVTPVGLVVARLAQVLDLPDLDPQVRAAVAEAHALAAGLDPYLEANAGPESPSLRALSEATVAHDWSRHPTPGAVALEQEMLSGHVEGALLRMLVRATGARRVLEIGMFTGYSALALAEAVPTDGSVIACEIDPGAAEMARSFFTGSAAGERIEVRVGPALDTLAELAAAGSRFDLVFIDADKAGYLGYLHTLLEGSLLAAGALVCVDNTLMQGQPWTTTVADEARTANGRAVAAFNAAVVADPRLEQVVIPLRDGLTLIRRADDPDGREPA